MLFLTSDINGGGAEGYFGRIEGGAGKQWRITLLIARPVLGSY